jgi:hypothetical protein
MENVSTNANIVMDNEEKFDAIIVKRGSIDKVEWFDPNYVSKLMKLDLYDTITMNKDNFLKIIGESLEIQKINIPNLNVISSIIGEEPNYLYELFYVDIKEHKNNDIIKEYIIDDNINHMGSLLNTNGDTIYGNCIIFKNYFPSLTDNMKLISVTKKDIEKLLYHRVHTKIVIYDDMWKEQTVEGDLKLFADKFFEGDYYNKIELGFLYHNINIWYSPDYGEIDICGKLVNDKIEKCIIFTMKTEEFRGNITLDEVNKIIKLSRKLDNFNVPEEYTKEKIDKFGRKIINDKYKILDYFSSIYKI